MYPINGCNVMVRFKLRNFRTIYYILIIALFSNSNPVHYDYRTHMVYAHDNEQTILSPDQISNKSMERVPDEDLRGKPQPENASKEALSQTSFEIAKHTYNLVIGIFTVAGVLIATMTLLASIAGFIGVKTLWRYVEDKIKEEADKIKYQMAYKQDVIEAVDLYVVNIELAIANTKRALTSGYLATDHIVAAKTNLAYYYAHRGDRNDKQEALRFANEAADEGIHAVPQKYVDLLVNVGYVRLRFAGTEEEKEESREYLRNLLGRNDCTKGHKEEIDRYLQT